MPKLQSSPSSGEGLKDGGQANPADATEDLFSPGAGQPPPHLAGRGLELQSLADVLRKRLQKGLPPKNAVLLHGARGTGKTCLMRQALADLPSNIKQVHLDADDFLHAETMANAIINQAMRGRSIAKRTLNFSVGATVGGTGGHITIGRGEGAPARTICSIMDALEFCAKGVQEDGDRMSGAPLLIAIDEVQSVKGKGRDDRLKTLLKGVQHAGGVGVMWPVGLVMTGTPDAYGHVRACGTFAERMIGVAPFDKSNIPLGSLNEQATAQAIAEPLSEHGITVDDDVLDMAWQETMGHAYFVQAFGKSLCESLQENAPGSQSVGMDIAEAALTNFNGMKRQRYEERRMELQATGSLEAALLVAQCIFEKGPITSDQLDALCNAGVGMRQAADWQEWEDRSEWADTGKDAKSALLHAGLIWGPNGSSSAHYEFGIPSLAGHTLQYAAASGMRHLRGIADPPDSALEAKSESGLSP